MIRSSQSALWVLVIGSVITIAGCSSPEKPMLIQQFAIGGQHSCALLSDGSAKCWGFRGAGAIADGDPLGAGYADFQLGAAEVQGLHGPATKLAVGDGFTCSLMATGAVECWGAPVGEVFGRRLNTVPTVVPGLEANVIDLAAFGGVACVVKREGSVWCWGDNSNGLLQSHVVAGETPVPISLPGEATLVGVELSEACAALVDQSVWCWGARPGGLNSALDAAQEPPPARLALPAGGLPLKALGVAQNSGCALAADSRIRCWGNWVQERNSPDPNDIIDQGARRLSISFGAEHVCELWNGQVAFCWGANYSGQTGDVGFIPLALPPTLLIGAGGWSSCAQLADGKVVCWGANAYGQLGNGTRWGGLSPTQVLGF